MDQLSVQLWDLILKDAPLEVQLKARTLCKLLRTASDYHLKNKIVPKTTSWVGDELLHTLPIRVNLTWNKVDWRYERVSYLVAALELNASLNGWLVAVDRIDYSALRELVLYGQVSIEVDLGYLPATLLLDRLVISNFSLDKVFGAVKGVVAETEIRSCWTCDRDISRLVPNCKNWRFIDNIGQGITMMQTASTLYVRNQRRVQICGIVEVRREAPIHNKSETKVLIYQPSGDQVGLRHIGDTMSGVELLVVHKPHLPLTLYELNHMFPALKAILHVQTLGRGLMFENLVLFDPAIDVGTHPIYTNAVIPGVDFDFSKPSLQGIQVPEIVNINARMIRFFIDGGNLEELDLTTIKY